MAIFEHAFMQRAFLVGVLLAVIIPCVGVIIVLKRLSMIGDALSHTSLAGVAAGLIMGFNPIAGAVAACIAAALGIEIIRKKIPRYAEMSIAIVMAAGIGLAGVLQKFVKSSANFNSFLFGSIVSVDETDVILVAGISIVVLALFLLFYKELFYVALDERSARIAGVPVRAVNFLFTILTAVTVSIAAKTVGALMVSSMMVVPVACSMQVGRSYKQTVWYSVAFCVAFTVTGLFLSYYLDLRPGATIVLVGVCGLLLLLGVQKLVKTVRKSTAREASR